MGAATGLFEGLSQGIPIAEQIQRRKEESARQNSELALQKEQVGRRNAREDASKRAAAMLAQAAMMNEGAPSAPGGGPGGSAPALGGLSGAPGAQGYTPPPQVDDKGRPVSGIGWMFDQGGQAMMQPIPLAVQPQAPQQGPPAMPPGMSPSGAPQGPQPEQGPGTGGPPLQGPPESSRGGAQPTSSFGSPGTDWLHGQLANPDNGFSMEDTEKILAAHQHDLHLNAITQHGARIAQTIQTGLDKGVYDAVDKDGHPDPTARIEMEKNLRKIQSLDRSDPRAAAAQLDEIENAESAARQYKSNAEKVFLGRQRRIQSAQAEIAQIGAQGPISPADHERADQMQSVVSDFQNGNIDDKEFGAKFEDARHGNLLIKQQLQQSQMEAAQAKADRDRAIAELNLHKATQGPPPQPYLSTKEGVERKSELDRQREIDVARIRAEAGRNGGTGFSKAKAIETVEKMVHDRFDSQEPSGGFLGIGAATEKEKADYESNKADYRGELYRAIGMEPPEGGGAPTNGKAAGGGMTAMDAVDRRPGDLGGRDSASAILSDKNASPQEKIRRAQALGFKSYAEVEAAAKGGK